MIFENSHTQVYLAAGHTDMRKSINGLAVLVKRRLQPGSVFNLSVCLLQP